MTRCSYCYQHGHNKRTCPSRPRDEIAHEKAIVHKTTRTCSVCGEIGHNAKTCNVKKQQLRDIRLDWMDAREKFIDRCEKHQFDVGALVEYKSRRVGLIKALVVAIEWDRVDADYSKAGTHHARGIPCMISVKPLGEKEIRKIYPPKELLLGEVVNSFEPGRIVAGVPDTSHRKRYLSGWTVPSKDEVELRWLKGHDYKAWTKKVGTPFYRALAELDRRR